MRSIPARILLVAIALSTVSSVSALAEPKADPNRARIESLGKKFVLLFNRADFSELARMYAEDAMIFPPESNALKGRVEIETFWRGAASLGIRSMSFEVLDVESSGNFAVETGKANLNVQGAGPTMAVVTVKYVVVWKKQKDGSWKLYRDIWNAMPPPPAAGASSGTAAVTPAAPPPTATPTPAPHH